MSILNYDDEDYIDDDGVGVGGFMSDY